MREATRAEHAVIERLASGPIEKVSPADLRQVWGKESNGFLANLLAVKFNGRFQELRPIAVQLGLVEAPAPRNLDELLASQRPPQSAPPIPETPTAREAEDTPKAEGISWEELQRRANHQMDSFSLQQSLLREREEKAEKERQEKAARLKQIIDKAIAG